MSKKLKISLVVNEEKWTTFRKKCLDKDVYYSEQVENLIDEWAKKK